MTTAGIGKVGGTSVNLVHPFFLNTSLRRFLKGSNLEFLTLHCLRHSNATLLLNAGVDIKVVSEHLGHSDIGVTADIYADVLDATRRKTADILDFKLKQA